MKNGATLLLVCTLALAKKLQCRSFAVALWEAKSAGLLACRTAEIRTADRNKHTKVQGLLYLPTRKAPNPAIGKREQKTWSYPVLEALNLF